MTADEFAAALKRLDLTQQHAAHLLGVSQPLVSRYLSGKTPIPGPVSRIMWLCEYDGEVLVALTGIYPLHELERQRRSKAAQVRREKLETQAKVRRLASPARKVRLLSGKES